MERKWAVRHVRENEFDAWTHLFRGYCAFYQWETSDDHQREIWRWIHDDHSVEALVAVATDDRGHEIGGPRALAHLREWVRPLRGVRCGYLDDLYVDVDARGSGAVDAIFRTIEELAVSRQWAVVRWTTAVDNHRAQSVYDKVAVRTPWVTYDLTPGHRRDA